MSDSIQTSEEGYLPFLGFRGVVTRIRSEDGPSLRANNACPISGEVTVTPTPTPEF